MEHRIGEIVTLSDGRKAEVVEFQGEGNCLVCKQCVFGNMSTMECDNPKAICQSVRRADNKNIIYKEIKEK